MPKPPRGGKRGISVAVGSGAQNVPASPTLNVAPPTPQQIAQGNTLPNGGVDFDEFMKMSDDDKADVLSAALGTQVPMFLDDSYLQRFAYFTGMNKKPTLVTDAQLDGMKGEEIFRTVSDAYNRQTDIGYSASDITKQIMQGDFTMYSDSGGSAYGKAIYFANDYNSSAAYGRSNSITMRAKINPNAKTISYTTLQNKVYSMRGTKLYRSAHGDPNTIALALGYQVVTDSSSGYRMVLDRSALTVSTTTKKTRYGGSW